LKFLPENIVLDCRYNNGEVIFNTTDGALNVLSPCNDSGNNASYSFQWLNAVITAYQCCHEDVEEKVHMCWKVVKAQFQNNVRLSACTSFGIPIYLQFDDML